MVIDKHLPAVLLDLDDTLLDFHKAEAIALTKTLVGMGIEPKESTIKRYSQINARQWELLEEGKATREQVLTNRFEILFEELGIERSGYEARLSYEGHLAVGHYFMDGAQELLETLKGRYVLYIVSNGTAVVQDGRIKSAGISPYFKEIFISELIGFNKPDPEFFRLCFERMEGFEKERCIIVGDSLSSDIKGGINAGINTCWYNPRGKTPREDIKPDYEIKSLNELPKLLEKLF